MASDPANLAKLFELAIAHHQAGNLPEAERHYRAILQASPRQFDALHYLGVLQAQGERYDDAVTLIRRALKINPRSAEALANYGNVLRLSGRPAEALAACNKALALAPDHAGALTNRGAAMQALGRYAEALASYDRALALNPRSATALNNRGVVLKELQRLEDALASFDAALAITPSNAEAHCNRGNVLQELGRFEHALGSYGQALAIRPGYPEALMNRGNALQELQRTEDALTDLRQAILLRPDYAEAHYNLGRAFKQQGKLDDAVASYRKALSLKPDFAEAHYSLGNALQDQGKLDDAIAGYRKALSLKPGYRDAHGNLLFCLNYHPDLPAEEIFAEYRRWNDSYARPLRGKSAHANSRGPLRRLRIGYVSPYLRLHSTRHFIEPLLAHHDKSRVEVFAYAEVPKEDAVSARFKGYVEQWRRTIGLNDDEVATLIRHDDIDILVDLAGHTTGNRLLVFARKPAPVQVSWLGYGYTTGMDAMDYLMADAAFAPAGCESLFAEKIVRLPVFTAYRPAENMGETGALPALQAKGVTFGTLSRSVRINHRVIHAWAAILNRLPDARLVINSGNFRDAGMQARMREQFAARGIAAERLLIGYDSPPWDVLRRIDISLDCFPHNSGTTLFESLYLGVPLITLAERPSVGRLGSAILTALGHPEWIAMTEEEYEDKAVALATDIDRLVSLRAGLRDQMQRSALMDEPAFARSVEAAYREMWQKWCGE